MFTNYLKIAWRNLVRNKIFSFIKIAGLSIGLCVCMLILLYTKDEVSYDQFHASKMQIYRIVQTLKFGADAPQKIGISQPPLGSAFKSEIPGVKDFVRINGDAVTIKHDNEVFNENPLFVDDNFFKVFSFALLQGDAKTALKQHQSVVLTETTAKKYFGTTDVVGKTLQVKRFDDFENFVVTGIAADAPQNSSIKFDMLMPMEYYLKFSSHGGWIGGSLNTFLLLSPNTDVPVVEKKMQAIFHNNTKSQIEAAAKEQNITVSITLNLQPLSDIHLNRQLGADNGLADSSNPMYSYILGAIAIFVLIIACINFINLAIAQSLKRSREIGIRKVVGGTRGQLIRQFLTESFIVACVAFLIAMALTSAILPWFNELADKKLSLAYLADVKLYIALFLLLMVTSFVAGIYPSLVLSAFKPVKVLYSRDKMMGRNYLTRGLVILQFALAVFFIIGTFAIRSQVNFMLHSDLGYDSKNLVSINLPLSQQSNQLAVLLKNELTGRPGIEQVSARHRGRNITAVYADAKQVVIDYNKIDNNFFPAFKIPIIAGRNFSPDYPSDSNQAVIINESFAREAGWKTNEAVGRQIQFMEMDKRKVTVVGVIKDYHFTSLKEKIGPQLFSMDSTNSYGELWVKLKGSDIPRTLALVKDSYLKYSPLFPYDYRFLEETNARNYESEMKWKRIIVISSVLFVFISCIGLLGLVILSVEQRTREIGIRKVLGAAVSRILILISKEFMLLISIAFIIAVPAAWYAINQWLENFAYRVPISWWFFVIPGMMVAAIAFVTISFQAIKAAIANPVKSLRTE